MGSFDYALICQGQTNEKIPGKRVKLLLKQSIMCERLSMKLNRSVAVYPPVLVTEWEEKVNTALDVTHFEVFLFATAVNLIG